MSIQSLDSRFPITNPDGTPTEYFLRIIRDRGSAQVQSNNTIEELDANKADKVTQMIAGTGLAGGGDLSAGRTFNLNAVLDMLNDVDTTTVAPTNGQTLVFDSGANLWKPGTISGGSGSYEAAYIASNATQNIAVTTRVDLTNLGTVLFNNAGSKLDTTTANRITIGSGVSKIRIIGSVAMTSVATNAGMVTHLQINGGPVQQAILGSGNYTTPVLECVSRPFDVTAGDYVTLAIQSTDSAYTVANNTGNCFLGVEVLT